MSPQYIDSIVRVSLPAQRSRVMGYFLLATCMLIVYLAFHALPCASEHSGMESSPMAGSVSEISAEAVDESPHDHPSGSHCEHVPSHASVDPHCLAVPRAADGSGLALSALLFSLLSALTHSPAIRRFGPTDVNRTSGPRPARQGKAVLCVLCVMRR